MKIERRAIRQFSRMDRQAAQRLRDGLLKYEADATGDVKRLRGRDGYRLRVGDYRAIFDIIDNEIVVLEVGPRGSLY